jgi:hypothetical protein
MFRSAIAVALSLLIVACGGGGSTADTSASTTPPPGPTLSVTQKNFEAAALGDAWYKFAWSLPSINVAPTSGMNFMFVDKINSPASPASGTQNAGVTVLNLTRTLSLPAMSQIGVSRVLKSGYIYLSNHDSKITWTYSGGDVHENHYATDGVTLLYSGVHDDWSAPIPLSGQIGATSIVKSFLGFTKLTAQTVNFDFNQTWLFGSNYFTRKTYQKNDTLFIYDCSATATYTEAVNSCSGSASTIEGIFASPSVTNSGGVTVDGVLYNLASGTIVTVEGARTWIANAKRPTGVSPTDSYLSYIELNGKIYIGNFIKAGTREMSVDGVDATIVNDYNIRLNSTAGSSIKAAIKF